jgi:hypothetical protein
MQINQITLVKQGAKMGFFHVKKSFKRASEEGMTAYWSKNII